MEVSRRSTEIIDKLEGQSNCVDCKFQVRIQLQVNGVMYAVMCKLANPDKPGEKDIKALKQY